MPEVSVDAAPLIDWGVAALPQPGQTQSGDLHLVKAVPRGVLLAVVDGLGHGDEAANAARTAVATLDRHAGESLQALLQRCSGALKGSRGVVMSLAFIDSEARDLTWAGVGNVEGVVLRHRRSPAAGSARATLITPGGIVGAELPSVPAQRVTLAAGDIIVFATDGIRQGFTDGLPADAAPQQLADHILSQHSKGTDDALVLVARYRGGTGTSG